ncbi:universal stress protein [Sphingosinicella rhizophila]|uniref:Universal stress protein n=1 Tax=Sphingosinicella rhizophila TaxID=3050082 RepID=A0ABU3Q6F7_9SPHN|nr:universal stress protein [Sphingosinicella sp. GR2756]MDT9599003.1 universal stress protein [Sphingosinicella sp. GR2756]
MIKTILLDAGEDSAFETRFQAALELADRFKAHLVCLEVVPVDILFSGDPLDGNVLPSSPERIRARSLSHRRDVEDRLRREGVSFEWIHEEKLQAEAFADRSALADLVVLSGPDGHHVGDRHMTLASSLAVTGGPLSLCIPFAAKPSKWNGPALVAWDCSIEAAHVLRKALPLLKEAAGVELVTVGDERSSRQASEARLYLERHGISSKFHLCHPADGDVADAILAAASALNAKFIVMGAFGHSRFVEAVLGGVTRAMMTKSPLPLLLGR